MLGSSRLRGHGGVGGVAGGIHSHGLRDDLLADSRPVVPVQPHLLVPRIVVSGRGARIVVFDAEGVRAPVTASWLRQSQRQSDEEGEGEVGCFCGNGSVDVRGLVGACLGCVEGFDDDSSEF